MSDPVERAPDGGGSRGAALQAAGERAEGLRERRFLRLPLRVEVGSEGGGRTDYAINLSPGGLCLQTASPRPPGTQLPVCFALGPGPATIRATAEVVWSYSEQERAPGMRYSEMGLRFVDLSPADVARIEHFIQDVCRIWADE